MRHHYAHKKTAKKVAWKKAMKKQPQRMELELHIRWPKSVSDALTRFIESISARYA